jgi:hypothetical protein
MIRLLIALFTFAACFQVNAQTKSVSIKNFTALENEMTYDKNWCLKLDFEVSFNWYESIRENCSFELSYRLMDLSGKEVYSNPEGKIKKVQASKVSGQNKMSDKYGNELNFLYSSLDLPSGQQTIKVLFSLKGKDLDLPDFFSKTITFEHRVITKHPFEEQEFRVTNISAKSMSKGFAVNGYGITTKYELALKYGLEESNGKSYKTHWEWHDLNGNILANSQTATSIRNRTEILSISSHYPAAKSNKLFTAYSDLMIAESQELRFLLFVNDGNGHEVEIINEVLFVEAGDSYRYEDQEITIESLQAIETREDNANGVHVTFSCSFKEKGILLNPEGGHSYNFYPEFRDAHGVLLNAGSATKKYAIPITPEKGVEKHTVEIFIPYQSFSASAGQQDCSFTLKTSNNIGTLEFDKIARSNYDFMMPKRHTFEVNLSSLTLLPSDYDNEAFLIGDRRPDIMWLVKSGGMVHYSSSVAKNSFDGKLGIARGTVLEGDQLLLMIYDVDYTWLNPNDQIGTIELDYLEKGNDWSLKDYEQGLVSNLDLKFHLD